jgi:hypothetical protein
VAVKCGIENGYLIDDWIAAGFDFLSYFLRVFLIIEHEQRLLYV